MSNGVRHSTPDGYIHAWSGDLADALTELPTRLLELPRTPDPPIPNEWADDLHSVRRVLHGIRRM